MDFSTFSQQQELINNILNLSFAPLIVKKINSALEEEQKQRHHFYQSITEQEKAEFINGEIIIHSPVIKIHNEVCSNAFRLIDAYIFKNNVGFVGIEKILIQLTRNDYEPDVCFFAKETSLSFTDDQKFFPAPDFIIEVISESTEQRDRGIKFQDYEAHEVKEYWIIDPKRKNIEQYTLTGRKYELLVKSDSGNIHSKVIPGFSCTVEALFDRVVNYAEINRILVE